MGTTFGPACFPLPNLVPTLIPLRETRPSGDRVGTNGSHLTWPPPGSHLVPTRFPLGSHLSPLGSPPGPHLVPTGPHLAPGCGGLGGGGGGGVRVETTRGQGIVFTTKQHVGNAANQNSRLTCSLQARRSLHKLERTPCKQVPSSPYIIISGTDFPCVSYPAARHARCTQPAHVVPTIFAQREQHTPAMKQRATTAQHQVLSRTALW